LKTHQIIPPGMFALPTCLVLILSNRLQTQAKLLPRNNRVFYRSSVVLCGNHFDARRVVLASANREEDVKVFLAERHRQLMCGMSPVEKGLVQVDTIPGVLQRPGGMCNRGENGKVMTYSLLGWFARRKEERKTKR
jgi:hypothetical protein